MVRGSGSGRRMDSFIFALLLLIGAYMPYKCRAQTSCRAAGSLDTVLLNYGSTSDYLVTESEGNKRIALEDMLVLLVAIDKPELMSMSLQSLVELAAMVDMLNQSNIEISSLNSVEIRVTLERQALQTIASDEAALFAPVIGLMSANDVIMLLCGEETNFNGLSLTAPDVEEGCYSSSAPSAVMSLTPPNTAQKCLAVCRSNGHLYAVVDDSTCACSGLTSELGTRAGAAASDGLSCDNAAHSLVLYTGLGHPTVGYENPSSLPATPSDITEFNALNIEILDGVAINNNNLLGMKEVVFPSSLDRFFVAVYHFSVALFKLNKADDGALTYTYIQHYRWDGANFIQSESESWIMNLNQSSSDFLNAPTTSNPADLQRASWFAIVPMFVKQTANLYSTLPVSLDDTDFSTNLAGLPNPGGLWCQQLVILHEDQYTNFVNVNPPQVTALRLIDGRLEQLHTVTSDLDDGAFFMRDPIQKNAVSSATKLFGRRSLLLIGSRNDDVQVSYVEGFELSERKKEFTQFASYGQVYVERRLRISGNSITAIEVAELSKSYLLVLDRANENGADSRLRVLKFVDIETVEQVDEKVFTGVLFTKMNFFQSNGKSYVLLSCDTNSVTVQINHRGYLVGNLQQITSEPSVSVLPFNYGWLKNEVGFAALTYKSDDGVCNFQIYTQTADEVSTAAQTVPCNDAPQATTVVYQGNQAIFFAGESYGIHAFSYQASILPTVDQSFLRNTEWDTMQHRVNSLVAAANDKFSGLSSSLDLYLLKSGSVINNPLVLENLSVTETLSLPAGSLANTNVNFNLKSSEETVTLDYGNRINIALADVETALDTAESNFEDLLSYPDNVLLKSATGTHYLSSLAVSSLHSDSIGFFGEDISLDVTTFKSGDVTENFDHLIDDLYTKNTNSPVKGSKSFELISASSLDTQILSDGSLTILTENLLLKSGGQSISARQTFNLPVSIDNVELQTDVGFETSPVIINVKDLEENNAATGFRGKYHFTDTVNAPNISASTETSGSIELDVNIMDEIALSTEESVFIEGKLIVNLVETAIGSCILVKDGIINNIKFKDLAENIAATHCSSICIGKEVNFMENIKIEGNVEFKQDFVAPMINSVIVEDYVKQADFSVEDFLVTGNKTLTNTLSAGVVSADSFNGYTLDKLITRSTNQAITGLNTFHNNVNFAAIAGSVEDSVPLTDGQNFLALFRSDLNAVRDQKPWITEPLTSSFEFSEIDVVNAPVEVSSQFNGMNIAENLAQIILSTDQAVEVVGTKTFSSAVDLATVVVEKVTNGGVEYTLSDIVNTKVPHEISGVKTFTNSVTMTDVFMVDTAKVNDIDFSEVLSCFVNINADTSAIVIESPVYFDSIVTSDFSLEMNSDLPSVVCPADVSLEAAWRLWENREFEEIPSDLKDEVLHAAAVININTMSSDADIALDAMLGYYLLSVNSEPQFSVGEVNDMNQEEKKLALHLKIQRTFGLSDDSLTDLQLVQRFCKCLQLNGICAQQDLVLNDANNEFCSADNNCVQYFNKGIYVNQMNVVGVIHMNPEYTIFNVDIDKLELERISLSRNQIWSGNYNLTELRMTADGTYEGRVLVQHGDEVVDSVNYRSKFLNSQACSSTQTFTASKHLGGGLTAQSLSANLLQVSDGTVDLEALYQNGLSTVNAESFENLVFADNVIYNGNIESHGKLDGINLVGLARDLVVQGPDIIFNPELTVTGTDSAQITFNSVKVMSKAPEVGGKVIAFVEDGEVYPTMVFKPCSRPSAVSGLLDGTMSDNPTVDSLDDCHLECRRADCAGLSFNPTTGECRLMSISNQRFVNPDYISISYTCWFQIMSTETSKYLSVDPDLGTIITRTEPDSWRTVNDQLVHRSTGLAITSLTTESGITVELKTADPDNSKQLTTFTEAANFKIINADTTYELKENVDGTVGLVSSDAEPTLWNAGFVGEKFSYDSEGVPVPRIFTKSTNQEINGDLLVDGNVKFKGSLLSNTVGDLDVDSLAARYSYSTADSKHMIAGDLVLTGDLSVTDLTATTFDGRNFASFLQDILPQSSDSTITVTGSKTFINNVVLNNPNTQVQGDVVVGDTRIDLTALHTDTAFIDADSQGFSQLNTFNNNEADTLRVDMSAELTSYVGIQLNNPVMQNSEVNLDTLATDTIPRVSEVPASVQGKVIFSKDVTGSRSVNIANVRGATGASFSIPEDVVTVKDTTLDVSLDGKDRLFQGLATASGQELDIGGQIFGKTATDFKRVFYKDGDQEISGNLNFLENVNVANDLHLLGTLNSIVPSDNFVFLDAATTMTGSFNFPGILQCEGKVDVSGTVNGFDFEEMADNLFTRDTTQVISGEWNISSDTTFDVDVVGNGVTEDGDGIINGQKVVDLKSVNHIYEKVQAVKLSAQAEAATMCEFVSDLQESYVLNQGIKQFDIHSTQSDAAANYSCTELVFSGGVDRLFVLAIDGTSLKVFEKKESTLDQRATVEITVKGELPPGTVGSPEEEVPEGSLSIGLVLDLGDPESETFDLVVFVKTCITYTSTLLYRLSGNANEATLTKVGQLDEMKTVAKLGSELYSLGYTATEGGHRVRIELLDTTDLKNCADSCSEISRSTVWVGYEDHAEFPSFLNSQLEVVQHQDTYRVFAFNEINEGNRVVTPRLLYVKMTSQVSEDSSQLTHSYEIVNLYNPVGPTGDFSLLSIHDKVMLVSADGLLRLDEMDVVNNATVNTIQLTKLEGRFTDIQKKLNFLGDFNMFTALRDDKEVVFLKYSGLEGLDFKVKLDSEFFIASLSSRSMVSNKRGASYLALAGGNTIQLLVGLVHNPVTQTEFKCPAPEVSPSLIEPAP